MDELPSYRVFGDFIAFASRLEHIKNCLEHYKVKCSYCIRDYDKRPSIISETIDTLSVLTVEDVQKKETYDSLVVMFKHLTDSIWGLEDRMIVNDLLNDYLIEIRKGLFKMAEHSKIHFARTDFFP